VTSESSWVHFNRGGRGDGSRLIAAFACATPLVPGVRLSLHNCDEVLIGRGRARQWKCQDGEMLVAFPDSRLSRLHVRLTRYTEGWRVADLGSKNGTLVNGKRATASVLADGDLLELGSTLFVYRDTPDPVEGRGPVDHRDLAADHSVEVLGTLSLELEQGVHALIRVAPTMAPLLLEGEEGTGKEHVARAVHAISTQSGRFVSVWCRTVDQAAMAAELRRAESGTLFLDDIEELRAAPQEELCRLLDDPSLGVRVIASTRRDREGCLASGTLQPALYERLAHHHVVIPPLRERREDIGSIAATLLRRIAPDATGLKFDSRAAFALMTYAYPSNVRDLEAALRFAVPIAGEDEIRIEHLPDAIQGARPTRKPSWGAVPWPLIAGRRARSR
jgi:hypothetical protein